MVSKKLKKEIRKRSMVDDIIDYESGELDDKRTIKMFQKMVNTGQAWRLQGSYGRTAAALLEAGAIKPPKKKTKSNSYDYYGNQIW